MVERHLEVVAGLISHPERPGALLLSQRPAHKSQGGFWEFPGGKMEAGETPAQALQRELREELDIGAEEICPLTTCSHNYEDERLRVTLHFLRVGKVMGEPRAREGQKLAWLTPAEALALPVLAADVELLRKLAVQADQPELP